jgi:hypothetical protein
MHNIATLLFSDFMLKRNGVLSQAFTVAEVNEMFPVCKPCWLVKNGTRFRGHLCPYLQILMTREDFVKTTIWSMLRRHNVTSLLVCITGTRDFFTGLYYGDTWLLDWSVLRRERGFFVGLCYRDTRWLLDWSVLRNTTCLLDWSVLRRQRGFCDAASAWLNVFVDFEVSSPCEYFQLNKINFMLQRNHETYIHWIHSYIE